MAESKRGPGRPPGSKNKTTKNNTGAASSKAKAKAQEIQAKKKADQRVMDEIWAIITIAIGAFLAVATMTGGAGEFGNMIGAALRGVFGFMAYILPFYLILFGVLLFARKTSHFSLRTFLLLLLILLMLATMNSMRFIDTQKPELSLEIIKGFYTDGEQLVSGGFCGMILATLLTRWLGVIGCWIFCIVTTLVCLLFLINTPISRFFGKFAEKIEARKLEKQNAHLDLEPEPQNDAQDIRRLTGTQMKMPLAEPPSSLAAAAQRTREKREIKIINSSVLEAPKDEEPDKRAETDNARSLTGETDAMPQPETPEQKILSGVGTQTPETPEDEGGSKWWKFPKKAMQAHAAGNTPKPPQNSVLRYMCDDSLFETQKENGIGLEEQREIRAGYGIDGGMSDVLGAAARTYGIQGLADAEEASATASKIASKTAFDVGNIPEAVTEIRQPESQTQMSFTGKTAGTPDKAPVEKLSNKDAKAAMLTTEEINAQQMPKVYKKPPISLLEKPAGAGKTNTHVLAAKAQKLEETLRNFHVDARVVQVTQGPTVTRYEIQPSVGVKVSSIVRLADDIALNLEAKSIRIEAPIPGKAAVGIEVENDAVTMVRLREIIDSEAFKKSKSKITFAVGKDISGNAIVADLKSMPHLLIAGSTGSGKSVCINSIITSFIYKANPDEVKLILIDPKVVELGNYNGIPHLMIPVVTDPTKAAAALNWAVAEMTDRYKKFAEEGVRDLESYNEFVRANEEADKVMPQVVIIIDELADLMMAAPSQIEESICRLAQMARAAGMHLIVATQRPSVDVITGVIKANIPSRIAFAVSSQVDSRTILDMQGAEKLVGKGDMLFNPMGMGKPIRVQGTFVSDGEVHKVIEFVKEQVEQGKPAYNEDVLTRIERSNVQDDAEDTDDLLPDAIELVVRSGQASVSMLQRRFRIGYNRAARIVDMMEARGIVGPQDGSRPRQVLMTEEEFENMEKETEA